MYGIKACEGVFESLIFEYFLAIEGIRNKAEKLSFSALFFITQVLKNTQKLGF